MANCYGEELVQPAKHIELNSENYFKGSNKAAGPLSMDNSTITYTELKPYINSPTYNKAIKELEGMNYSITPKVIKSEFTDTYSVCITLESPWFGSFGTAKQLPGDSSLDDINKAKAKLVIGLWKQARERLLLGQLVA